MRFQKTDTYVCRACGEDVLPQEDANAHNSSKPARLHRECKQLRTLLQDNFSQGEQIDPIALKDIWIDFHRHCAAKNLQTLKEYRRAYYLAEKINERICAKTMQQNQSDWLFA